jgi:hypothetical protein
MNGSLNGKGKYIAANDDKYSGSFRNGVFSGQGTYTFAEDNRRYIGSYINGKRHG